MASPGVRLADLASELGREIEGDPEFRVAGVAALDRAGPGDLAYVRSARFAAALAATRAGALILPRGLDAGGRPAIRSPHPGLDFARAVRRLVAASGPAPGVHPTAQLAPRRAASTRARGSGRAACWERVRRWARAACCTRM